MKTKFTLFVCAFIISHITLMAQNIFPASGASGIGTTTPNSSSLLDIVSTTKGILIPRMTLAQRNAITTPATGLLIFQTTNTPGFYYYSGTAWTAISSKGANTALSNLVNTAVNADLKPGTDNAFDLGKTGNNWKDIYLTGAVYVGGKKTVSNFGDANDNIFLGTGAGTNITTGIENIGIGNSALNQVQTGYGNIGIGKGALFTTTAYGNTAVGDQTMINNTTGFYNTSFGYQTLYSNTTGIENTAYGAFSLKSNTTGNLNTSIGFNSLQANTTGSYNTTTGQATLWSNTTGYSNTATGFSCMSSNTTGYQNTASGVSSMSNNTSGILNTASGFTALYSNTTGSWNTAIGTRALYINTAQDKNTAVGWSAGDGFQSSACTYLGYNAQASAVVSGSMALGINAVVTASNQVRIGTSAITSIGGFVNWSNISDGRYKKNIQSNVPGLAFINSLKPVTYTLDIDGLDKKLNPTAAKNKTETADEKATKEAKKKILYSGFVAQDVETSAKKLGYDFSGIDAPKNDNDLYGLRYAEFVVPLVKAVQELSKTNDNLQNQINAQQKEIEDLKELVANKKQNSSSIQTNTGTAFMKNAPNPFGSTTTISYSIPQRFTKAQIVISDGNGKQLKLFNLSENHGTVSLDANSFSSGTYYYTLHIDGKQYETRKMSIIR